ncbi:MAG: PcfJ domain-containing protein [Muribaculaceae bacterium]|nr:PcfJ domain-containing protein [Muribaculaceae bacterium]
MRPRNDRQRTVVALSAALPPLTAAQQAHARRICFTPTAYVCRRQAWCSECGETFTMPDSELSVAIGVAGRAVCPHCGARLKAEASRRRKASWAVYFTVLTTRRGWQVCRHFVAEKHSRAGHAASCILREAVQSWIMPDGSYEVMARHVSATPGGAYDRWVWHSPLELRDKRNGRVSAYSPHLDKYSPHGYVCPGGSVLPLLRRNGFTRSCDTLPVDAFMRMILRDREAEVLAKAGQWELIAYKHLHGCGEFGLPFQHAVRIACRHAYRVSDAQQWFDLLHMLDAEGRDTRSPHYILPADLRGAHDALLRIRARHEAEEEARRKIAEAARNEAAYLESRGRYFGLCFQAGGITVRTIRSVREMAEEGAAMHHCVYSAGYYRRPESLILTARDSHGRRLETVEVSLRTFTVVQSRAACNGTSPRHDAIIALVEQNMNRIKEITDELRNSNQTA